MRGDVLLLPTPATQGLNAWDWMKINSYLGLTQKWHSSLFGPGPLQDVLDYGGWE